MEWPIRCKLATLAGFPVNPKNPRALIDTEFDKGLSELVLEIFMRKPENAGEALQIVRYYYKCLSSA